MADIATHVMAVPWFGDHGQRIITSLSEAAHINTQVRARRKEQDFMTFLDYLTKATWDVQLDPSATTLAKQDSLVNAFVRIKCPNPSAHTLKLATSAHLFCSLGFERAMAKSQTEKGNAKDAFKTELKRIARHSGVESDDYMLKLPPRPSDLQRLRPTTYGKIFNEINGYPIQPPIDVAKIAAIAATFGCRNNDRHEPIASLAVLPMGGGHATATATAADRHDEFVRGRSATHC